MKKFFIIASAIMAFGMSSFAENDYKMFLSLKESSTIHAVSYYVGADFEQESQLRMIMQQSADKMKKALDKNDEIAAKKAMYYNLANTKAVLSSEQYKKYLSLLNVTSYNRGGDLLSKR